MRLIGTLNPSKNAAIVAGAFNPPTIAHLSLAAAGRQFAGQALFVIPERFPHKEFDHVTLEDRIDMLARLGVDFAIAVTRGGLFLDIARELRESLGFDGQLYFACGADTARRIVEWDYRDTLTIGSQLYEYELLVADRGGSYSPPEHLKHQIHSLALPGGFDAVSSTGVRQRIAANDAWEHLVPEPLIESVRRFYAK